MNGDYLNSCAKVILFFNWASFWIGLFESSVDAHCPSPDSSGILLRRRSA